MLFTVEPVADGSAGALPERIRLATLDAYDGEVYRCGGEGAVDAGRFVRVPAALDAGEGEPVEARDRDRRLDGIWMPTAGRLSAVEFAGDRAASLADRFYYNAAASAGVQTAGGRPRGGRHLRRARGRARRPRTSPRSRPPAGPRGRRRAGQPARRGWTSMCPAPAAPRSRASCRCCASAATSATGCPTATGAGMDGSAPRLHVPAERLGALAGPDRRAVRAPARARDRPGRAPGDNFVAAVGDDEQFAVAAALMARELGFPSRVVLGARLSAAEPGLATCDDGVCGAQDLTAWTEVQSAGGQWVPVDVTPQYAVSPSLDVTEQRDPENVTEVRPDAVEEVVPPDPAQEDSGEERTPEDDSGLDLAWLWPTLRIAGIALLVLALAFGPFLIVIGTKAARRRSRRRTGTPAARIAGGWDEYVDAAVDTGRAASRTLTRSELATAFATPAGDELARTADRAVFSRAELSADEAPGDTGTPSTRSGGRCAARMGSGAEPWRPYR